MLKKISKSLLSLLLIILTISSISICYATDTAVTTSETENTVTTENATETEETEIKNDLYFFDTNVVIDKVVYGNVYAIGNKVDVTAKIEGNLFVLANELNLNESYVAGSIYACARKINYNGAASYIYMMSNKLEMTYNSYVIRDAKIVTSNAIIKSAIGRDMDLICNEVNFGEGEDIPLFYGNLRYTANQEVEIPENAISNKDNITYTNSSLNSITNTTSDSITDIIIGFVIAIVTALALYIILSRITPNFVEKLSNTNFSAFKLFRAFGIGLVTMIVVLIFTALLLGTVIGSKLAIILALLFAVLCLIAIPTLTISITSALKPTLKIEKTSMFYLIIVLVSIVLYGITLIPFVGGILGLIIKVIAIGLLIDMYIPHKELTDEEKAAIEEAKKQAKENKEKRKQEKLEAKAAKKQAKLEEKKASNSDETEGPIQENKD